MTLLPKTPETRASALLDEMEAWNEGGQSYFGITKALGALAWAALGILGEMRELRRALEGKRLQ